MRIRLTHIFEDIIRVENLLAAWREFLRGKRTKPDVAEFSLRLMDHIFELHSDLAHRKYRHGPYHAFAIHDPKPRSIHKAIVRDRLLHHALHRVLYPFFDRTFISDSYSCRIGKGTHLALARFRRFGYETSRNGTRTCFILKCDIKKFFASVDHAELFDVLRKYIDDDGILWLIRHIVESFSSTASGTKLISCALCGSGITADEKFKKQLNGNIHRYVYYGCCRFNDKHCKSGYMREEDLIEQLALLIDKVDLDQIGMKESIKFEIERHKKFQSDVLGEKGMPIKVNTIDIRNYAKYLLREGTIFEKRELLSCLRSKLTMNNKQIVISG